MTLRFFVEDRPFFRHIVSASVGIHLSKHLRIFSCVHIWCKFWIRNLAVILPSRIWLTFIIFCLVQTDLLNKFFRTQFFSWLFLRTWDVGSRKKTNHEKKHFFVCLLYPRYSIIIWCVYRVWVCVSAFELLARKLQATPWPLRSLSARTTEKMEGYVFFGWNCGTLRKAKLAS